MRRLVVEIVATTAISAALVWLLILARQALLLIYISVLLAMGLSPVIKLIERQTIIPIGWRVIPRWLAILCVYVLVLGVLAGVGLAIVPVVTEQGQGLLAWLPQALHDGQRFLVAHGVLVDQLSVQQIVQTAPGSPNLMSTVFVTLFDLIGGVFGIVTLLILTFYLLIESDTLFDSIVRLFPRTERARVNRLGKQIAAKVSSWLTMQLLLAAAIGTSTAIGLGLLGIPYFYVLALLAALGEFVPYVGPVLAAIPGITVAMTSSWSLGCGVAAFYFVQQQVENYVLLPKMVGNGVGLNATVIIVALLLGDALLGVLGAMLAIPTAAIIQAVLQSRLLQGQEPS